MSTSPLVPPKRGEVWLVDFAPTKGAEIRKTRPAVVVSSVAIAKLPVVLVAPITGWKDHIAGNFWHVGITPDSENGLNKEGAVDALQLRGVDSQRLVRKLGRLSATLMEEIAAAIAAVVEYE